MTDDKARTEAESTADQREPASLRRRADTGATWRPRWSPQDLSDVNNGDDPPYRGWWVV